MVFDPAGAMVCLSLGMLRFIKDSRNIYCYSGCFSHRLQFFLLGQGNARGNAVKRSYITRAATHDDQLDPKMTKQMFVGYWKLSRPLYCMQLCQTPAASVSTRPLKSLRGSRVRIAGQNTAIGGAMLYQCIPFAIAMARVQSVLRTGALLRLQCGTSAQ